MCCLVAALACSSEAADEGATVPAFAGSLPPRGTTPSSPAALPAPAGAPTPTGTPTPNDEATQVTDLAPAPDTAEAAANAPSANGTPAGDEEPASPAPAEPAQPTEPGQTPPPQTPQPQPQPPAATEASAGCGVAQGLPASPITIADPNAVVTFPPGYDGNTPFPIVFAFHGANRTNVEMRMQDSRTPGSALENNYIMAFVKSQGTAWDLGTDYPRFQRLVTQLTNERCIDTGHIFAMGHSSGAQFIAAMLGDGRARESRFAAVAPVSSNNLNNPAWTPVPTLLIHGLLDAERPNDPNGAQDILQYAQANQCSGGRQPVDIGTCASIADANGTTVNPGCQSFNGCAQATLFCNHNDPNYLQNGNPTNHGWPCFANAEIFAFFEATRG